jgi:YidC/Oxa1 family membrane protein insertase
MFIANVLQPLIDACEAILRFWHDLIGDFDGSWGWSIILLTFTVRIAILPLTFRGVKSMNELQRLQPELKKIQERYKDDRQRMNQEIMRFYQEHKVNPLGSCLPLLLQIPFFISLFYLLRSESFKADLGDNRSFFFIDDLAETTTGDPAVLVTLIILYIGTQLAATLVTAISADPTQRRIMLALPFVFTIFIVNFEAGLIVYWITTNVWTIGQQLLVRKLYPKPPPIGSEEAAGASSKPARGKPPSPASSGAAALTDGKEAKEKSSAPAGAGNGTGAKPPPSPRKRKKRSGRRR